MTRTRRISLFAFFYTFMLGFVHCQPTSNSDGDSNIWDQLIGIIGHNNNASSQLRTLKKNTKQNEINGGNSICSTPCENGGICIGNDICRCINGWTGSTCSEFECTEPCLNGVCKGPETCFCDSGWTGITCSKPICNPSCLNQGQCSGPNTCRCNEGYSGHRCQDASCDPPCSHGNCYKPNQCTCDPGWQGPLCAEPQCSPTCQNGGRCTAPDSCSCTDEWRGYTCDIPICRNRCQNGGTCVAPNVCQCPPKYEGDSCQIALDKEAQAGRTCTVWGLSHFRTFDGHSYDFPGLCRYDLSKDTRDGFFSIELIKDRSQVYPSSQNGGSLNGLNGHSELNGHNELNGHDELNGHSDINGHSELNGQSHGNDADNRYSGEFMALKISIRGMTPSFTLLPKRKMMFGNRMITRRHFNREGVSVEAIGRYIRVKTRYGVTILWDGDGVVDIALEDEQYNGVLGGLCGNFDSDPRNDMMMRDGSPASDILDFGMAWKVSQPDKECADLTSMPSYCANQTIDQITKHKAVCDVLLLNLPAFQVCRDRGVDARSFASACAVDMCKCQMENEVDCTCSALTQYSRLCSHETGMSPKWREPNLCGVECPFGMVYEECASSCPRTCQSIVTPETDCEGRCIDGCACVNGTVLRNDNICVLEERCPCMHGDVSFPAGHVFKQNCMECQCMGALWNCKSLQCAGECSVVGDSHYTTFDGLLSKIYGECQFTFVKDCSDSDLFSVVVENSVCDNDLTETCVNEVLVIVSPISSTPGSATTSLSTNGHSGIKIRLGRNGRVTIDEQRVVLPLLQDHFQIYRVSSEFVQLRLSLGVTIEWDGLSRLYVKAERKWMNKLCGLCGNFNDNKKDDMLNFNGLVEKCATTFSNLWKVNADCKDATSDLNFDPCISNSQRAQFAKEKCAIIRSKVFQKCHPFVNPEEAEIMCRQDVCQCDKGIACLCNSVAHYARLCSKKGQIISWRTDDFCPVVCTGGKTFQQCGSSCSSTCRSISDPQARCSETCVEGCNCPVNTYLNEYDICVTQANCQCYHNGHVYEPFFIQRREFSVCHCRDGRFSCQTTNDWLSNTSIPLAVNGTQCPQGWTFHDCGNSLDVFDGYPRGVECQRTCNRLDEKCVSLECTSGCGCPENLVLDIDKNACVEESQCPCYYRGTAYYPGDITKVDCNTCQCLNRTWQCTENRCVGTCAAYGDPHFRTFDGYHFDFMGHCGYILTQDYCGNHEGQFRVYVENSNCGSDGVSCAKSVTITFTGNIYVKLNKADFGYGKKDLVTWGILHGSSSNHSKVLWDFHNAGVYTIVTTNIGLTVVWDRQTTLYVKLDPQYQGRVCGLCGDFDNNQNNDMMMSDRMPAVNPTAFANSWKIAASCDDAVERESQCTKHPQRRIWAQRNCKILYDPMFAVCHSVVDVVWYHSNCIFDACSCDNGGDCECLCTAIAAYAFACAEQGIKIRWRTDKVCPLMCEAFEAEPGECTWHYNECGSACPKTCQHQYLSHGSEECPLSMPCVEGCFPSCPNGTLYDETTKKCVEKCREGCHANGKFYYYDEIVTSDECRVCKCEAPGSIHCMTVPECFVSSIASTSSSYATVTSMPLTSHRDIIATTMPSLFYDVLADHVPKRYCLGEVQLGFVLDGSHRVTAEDFEMLKWIMEVFIDSVMPDDYGQENSLLKVAISQIGYETEIAMSFRSKQDVNTLTQSLIDLELQNAAISKMSSALRDLLADYEVNIANRNNATNFKTFRVLFLVTYSPADEEFVRVLHQFQDINVNVIVLSSGLGPSEAELKRLLGESATVFYINNLFEFTDDNEKGMQVLEALCEGETRIVPVPTTVPSVNVTTPASTTTTIIQPDEMCTMKADLVIIIDMQLLKNEDDEVGNFLQLLKSVASETLVRPDRTHVTILLSDSRVWRIGRFVGDRNDLIQDLENSLIQKVGEISSLNFFDLHFAIDTAMTGYLLKSGSGIRSEDKNVHKSILIFNTRPPHSLGSDNLLNDDLRKLAENEIVINVISQKGIFDSDVTRKADYMETFTQDNLVFTDISKKRITQTSFNRIMRQVCRTPPKLPIEKVFCEGKTDISFLWDDSGRISAADLKNMMKATKKVIGSLETDSFGEDEEAPVRLSIAQYSDSTEFLIETNQSSLLNDFLNDMSLSTPKWSMGEASNLGAALSKLASKLQSTKVERNKTVIIFTSRASTDSLTEPIRLLDTIGVKRIVIGFGQQITSSELDSISGDDGFFRRIASSREILDNDLGIAIIEGVCTPIEKSLFTTPIPTGSTVAPYTITSTEISVQSTSERVHSVATSTSLFPPPVCSMTSDMVVIVDASLLTQQLSRDKAVGILTQIFTELEIGDRNRASRVSIMVVDENPVILSDLEKEGSDKGGVLVKLNDLSNPRQSYHQSFPVVKAIRMANEFVFGNQPRKKEDFNVKKDILLVTNRLPDNEVDLFREDNLESVHVTIQDTLEQDINFYMIYTENAFSQFSSDEAQNWLSVIESNSFLLENSDKPDVFGSEVTDKICSVPLQQNYSTATFTTYPPLDFICKMDLVIVVDSSYSIGPEFVKIKDFLIRLISSLEVDRDAARVGVIQYSSATKTEFHMKDFIGNSTGLKEKIREMELMEGLTNTFTAIDYLIENEITEEAGKRRGVPLSILLLTDGRIKDTYKKSEVLGKLEAVRNGLQNNGTFLNVMAIGFASANPADLNELADSGTYVEDSTGFADEAFSNNTSIQLCTFQLRTTVKTTAPVTTPAKPVCSGMPKTDILFVLDGSVDLDEEGRIDVYRNFIQNMVDKFSIGPSETQVGVTFYAEGVFKNSPNGFGISDFTTADDVKTAISGLQLTPGFAFDVTESLSDIFTNHFSSRSDARKVAAVLLLTPPDALNGITTEDVFREAQDDDIETILMLGSPDAEFNDIIAESVGPFVDDLHKVPISGGVSNLNDIEDKLKDLICGEIPAQTTTEEEILTVSATTPSSAPSTTEMMTVSPVCDVKATVLFVVDAAIQLESTDISELVSEIESRVIVDAEHTQISALQAEKESNEGDLSVLDIESTLNSIIQRFESDRDVPKRVIILILKSRVRGFIRADQWETLRQQRVSMITIAINSHFLQSDATDHIPLLEIPITESQHLVRTSDAVINEICKEPVPLIATEVPSTASTKPKPVCPPGDVVIMYDASLLSPSSEPYFKSYLKDLVHLLSNTYSRMKTRFALVSFGEEPLLQFGLSSQRTPAQVSNLIQNSQHRGGNRVLNAAKALDFVMKQVASPAQRGYYVNVTLTMMMLMARPSADDLITMVETIGHKADLITLAIGYPEPNLDSLSTVPNGGIPVTNAKRLAMLEYETLELICFPYVEPTIQITTPAVITKPKRPCKVDIVFMVDEDLLKTASTLKNVRQYLDLVAEHLVFGEEFFKLSVKKFSQESYNLVQGFADSVNTFETQLDDNMVTSPVTGSLHLSDGLNDAVEELNSNGRSGYDVGKMVVFLLGRRTKNIMDTAQLDDLSDQGVMVFSVLVGDARYMRRTGLTNHLRGYIRAYYPRYLRNFASRLVYFLWNTVCAKRPAPTVTETEELPTESPSPIVKCSRTMDITYIIDNRLLVNKYERENTKFFMKDTAREFELKPWKTRLSALQYGTIPHPIFYLNSVFGIKEVFRAIDEKVLLPDYYNTANDESFVSTAITYAIQRILKAEGTRDSPKYIVLLSKMQFSDEISELQKVAEALREKNITLIMLAENPTSVEKINALEPHIELPFDSVDELTYLLSNVTDILCGAPIPKRLPKVLPTSAIPTASTAESTLSTKITTQPVDCSTVKLDLLILLQSTTFFSQFGSEQMKNFANNLATRFKFGREGVLTSVLQFNDRVLSDSESNEGFDFIHAQVQPLMTEAIFGLHVAEGNKSNPGRALQTVINHHLSADQGAREGVRKAIVMVMGGGLSDKELGEMNDAIRDAIERGHSLFILAIPTKDGKMETMDALSKLYQLPTTHKIFGTNSFGDLLNLTLVSELADKICRDVPYLLPPPSTTGPLITPQEGLFSTTVGFTTAQSTTQEPEKCPYDANIAFVMDISNLDVNNLAKMKEFVLRTTERFTISPDNTNIALIPYASEPQTRLSFAEMQNFNAVYFQMMTLKSSGKITNTGAALTEAAKAFTSARRDRYWAVFLITDGRSKDDITSGVEAVHSLLESHNDTRIIALGLRSAPQEQLNMIAGDNTIMVDSYNNLLDKEVLEAAKNLLCLPPSTASLEVGTTPAPATSSPRGVSVSSTYSSQGVCHCYWTAYTSRHTPTENSPGDDESWVSSSTANICRPDHSVFEMQCQSNGGYVQPNVKCDLQYPSPICYNFEVKNGAGCFDYSVSLKCCSSSCGQPTTPAMPVQELWRCNKRMDVVFILDQALTEEMLHNTKAMIGKLGDDMHLGDDYARSAIVSYGSGESDLSSTWTTDLTQWKKSLDTVDETPSGSSDVAKALMSMKQLRRDKRSSDNGGDVEKTVVVFLSDSSTGIVDGLVTFLQDESYQIMVVGLENPRKSLINRLATKESLIFLPQSTSELMNITMPQILEILCGSPTTPVPSTAEPSSSTLSYITGTEKVEKTTSESPILNVTMTTEPTVNETTTIRVGCVYFDDDTEQTVIIPYGEEIFPRKNDLCFSLRCIDTNQLIFDNKRLACERLEKPHCDNGFDSVMRFDESCNCQWECQCYCQISSTVTYTFDGLSYPSEGDCDQMIVKGSDRAVKNHGKLLIKARKEECGNQKCITQVHLTWKQDDYIFFKNFSSTANGTYFDADLFEGPISIDVIGKRKFVVKIEEVGLLMEYDPTDNGLIVSLPANKWADDTEGMCGTCNHVIEDELQLSNGEVTDNITKFLQNWTEGESCNITEVEPCLDDDSTQCEMIKTSPIFEECRENIDWERYYNSCKSEVCRRPNGSCEFLSRFADACRHQGQCVDWRAESVCPMNCTGNYVFKPCIMPPYEKSCKNETTSSTDIVEAVEGCFFDCKEGEVIINGRCMSEKHCTKCFERETGTFKEPGDFWVSPVNDCIICTCDSETLDINCQERQCGTIHPKPSCGVCEKLALKSDSDRCCPEYECVCDYQNCVPQLPKTCVDGMTITFRNVNDSCQPLSECVCDLDSCVKKQLTCDSPQVEKETNTTCCPTSECVCPICEENTTVCDVGFSKHIETDICNCSTITCDKMPVCIVSDGFKKSIKVEGEIWTNPLNPCQKCQCEKHDDNNYSPTCVDTSTACGECNEGFIEELNSETCCPKCVQEDCIIRTNETTKTYKVGEMWKRDECQNLTCIMVSSQPVITEVKSVCNRTVPDCGFGFKMECDDDPCCSKCKCVPDDVCIYNGSTIQIPGSNWTVNECTTCQCTAQKDGKGFNNHYCTEISCPLCQLGFQRHHIEGTCCGECLPTKCYIEENGQRKELSVGSRIESKDGCTFYKCLEDNKGAAIIAKFNVTCADFDRNVCLQQGGEVGYDEKGCCLICNFKKRECQVRNGTSMRVSLGDCTTDEEIFIPYCEGQCGSSAHYNSRSGDFTRRCTCCKPVEYENRTAPATCADNSKSTIPYKFVTSCSCDQVVCTEWNRISSNTDIAAYHSLPSEQDATNSVVSMWSSNKTIHVVDIEDVVRSVGLDLQSTFEDILQEVGITGYGVDVVQASARESDLRETIRKSFIQAMSGSQDRLGRRRLT